jgi:hypothetical protein
MAQTKKKRSTKHRGNAAGVVEARGRTGSKPSDSDKKDSKGSKGDARAQRLARLDQPPTWRNAATRSAIATLFFLVMLFLLFKHQTVPQKIALGVFVFLLYIPLGYYTDLFVFRRRQRRKGSGS